MTLIVKTIIGVLIMNLFGCISLPKTVSYDSKIPYIELNQYKFHTQIFGDKKNPTIIVLHGGPGGDFNYLKSLKSLSDQYFVIFYDQRGSGLSDRVKEETLTIEQHIADLKSFKQHFSPEKEVILIGHSWGGILATAYLNQNPDDVSHLVSIEPGMLNEQAAQAFAKAMKSSQSIGDVFALVKAISMYFFIDKVDGHEGFDYVMTQLLNRNNPGAPYQCKDTAMLPNSFIRGGYAAFNNTLKPIMDNPSLFNNDITSQLKNYKNKFLMLSSECSVFGYDFQNQYHIPILPHQTEHILAKGMGHNMITLNPDWSRSKIREFLL